MSEKLPHGIGRARRDFAAVDCESNQSPLLLLLGNTVSIQVFHPSDSIDSAMKIFPSAHCARDED